MNKLLALFLVLILASAAAGEGVMKKKPLPYEYGRVIINNYSENAGLPAVVFDHWLHRARFTCRLCHVDIGFAMKGGTTGIKATDNINGYYCGSCHNGKTVFSGKKVFESCSKVIRSEDKPRCLRCHSRGQGVKLEYDFNTFTQGFPKERFGNGIDWQKSEADGIIKPIDFLEGISLRRQSLKRPKEFALSTKLEGMPNIIFSHQKHTVWNGCELCHPDIFIGVKKGTTHYSMIDIFEGKYCGVCHVSVAFPMHDCQRCHTEPVQ